MLIYLPIILNYQKNQFINTDILCKHSKIYVTIHLVGERAFQHMSDSGTTRGSGHSGTTRGILTCPTCDLDDIMYFEDRKSLTL